MPYSELPTKCQFRLDMDNLSWNDMFQLPVIPIASGIEQHPIFVLREDSDASLIATWNQVLPRLSNLCLQNFSQLKITSIHLFRVGTDEISSQPTILVNTAQPIGPSEQKQIQWAISAAGHSMLNATPSFSVDRLTCPRLQLSFRQSRLRRSLGTSSLPPICQPRNRQFSSAPVTGASIGIAGSFQDTATLGCYLLIDKVPVVLTVDHLIPELLNRRNGTITHISQQDHFEILLPVLNEEIRSLGREIHHTCEVCGLLDLCSPESIHDFAKACLGMIFDGRDTTSGNSSTCPFYKALHTLCKSHEWHEVHRIARIHAQSGPRFQVFGSERREMDWALFRMMQGSCFGLAERILDRHEEEISRRPNELQLQPVKPGAFVRSLGRTSGHQIGQISTTISAIFHGAYATQEWCIKKRCETLLDDWVEGGIGVEGDSGALIVDQETDAVYGMLWGRSGDGPDTVTIFTPMTDIIHDVKERTKAEQVQLIRGQEMPRPDKAETLETQVESLLPSSVSPEEKSVPISLSLEEKAQDVILEEGMASFSITSHPSADTRHPHSFERYRGRDSTDRSIPRSTPDTTVENIASSQWPGVHTYFRYAVAPEQE